MSSSLVGAHCAPCDGLSASASCLSGCQHEVRRTTCGARREDRRHLRALVWRAQTRQSRERRPRRALGRSDSRPSLVQRCSLSRPDLACLGTARTFVSWDGGYGHAVVRRFVHAMFCGAPDSRPCPAQSGPRCLRPAIAFAASGHDVGRRRRKDQAQRRGGRLRMAERRDRRLRLRFSSRRRRSALHVSQA